MWLRCLTLLVLVAFAACSKSPRTAQASGTGPARTITPSAGLPSLPSRAALPAQKPGVTVAQEQPPAPPPAVIRQNTGLSSLLPLGREGRTLPQDFSIGPLGDARTGDGDERQAMRAAESFLNRLVDGKVDKALMDPEAASRLSDMLDFGLQHGDVPRDFRIGTPKKHETGEISASVRLFSDVGASEGEISVARAGGRWLVADLQISMDELKVKREKPKERFFPSTYRWLLEE